MKHYYQITVEVDEEELLQSVELLAIIVDNQFKQAEAKVISFFLEKRREALVRLMHHGKEEDES